MTNMLNMVSPEMLASCYDRNESNSSIFGDNDENQAVSRRHRNHSHISDFIHRNIDLCPESSHRPFNAASCSCDASFPNGRAKDGGLGQKYRSSIVDMDF